MDWNKRALIVWLCGMCWVIDFSLDWLIGWSFLYSWPPIDRSIDWLIDQAPLEYFAFRLLIAESLTTKFNLKKNVSHMAPVCLTLLFFSTAACSPNQEKKKSAPFFFLCANRGKRCYHPCATRLSALWIFFFSFHFLSVNYTPHSMESKRKQRDWFLKIFSLR